MKPCSGGARLLGGLLAVLGVGACVDPVLDDRTLAITATGVVTGRAFVDLDGNGTLGTVDRPAPGLELWLLSAGGGGVVATIRTDAAGTFANDSVPVGSYRLRVDRRTLPEGAIVAAGDSATVQLLLGDTAQILLRLSFPSVPLDQTRLLPPGMRVFTEGIALNVRLPFGDGVVHLQSGTAYLRATAVDRAGFQPGDSVRFLGTTARSEGLAVLTDVRPFSLVTQAALVRPVEVRTEEAARARDGSLDAALVRVRSARIVDTLSVGNDLHVTVNDGSGPVTVVLRDFLGFNPVGFRPQTVQILEGIGLLVPLRAEDGRVAWRITPRTVSDLQLRAANPTTTGP